MNWNPNHHESILTTPERHHLGIYDERELLGVLGDVILPDHPMHYTERELSGGSHLDGSESDNLGVSQTWRSVDDLQALCSNEARSRGHSLDS